MTSPPENTPTEPQGSVENEAPASAPSEKKRKKKRGKKKKVVEAPQFVEAPAPIIRTKPSKFWYVKQISGPDFPDPSMRDVRIKIKRAIEEVIAIKFTAINFDVEGGFMVSVADSDVIPMGLAEDTEITLDDKAEGTSYVFVIEAGEPKMVFVFVNGLPYEWDETDCMTYFSQLGRIKSVERVNFDGCMTKEAQIQFFNLPKSFEKIEDRSKFTLRLGEHNFVYKVAGAKKKKRSNAEIELSGAKKQKT